MCNKHVHSIMTRSSRFHCLIGVVYWLLTENCVLNANRPILEQPALRALIGENRALICNTGLRCRLRHLKRIFFAGARFASFSVYQSRAACKQLLGRIARTHCIDAVYCHRCGVVCESASVCLMDTTASPTNAAEPIERYSCGPKGRVFLPRDAYVSARC